MKTYMINFQDSQDIMTIQANSNGEARQDFNRNISVKLIKDSKGEQDD